MPPQRTPLAPRSANIGRKSPHLSPFKRGIILGKRSEGATKPAIARALNTPLNTIRYTLEKTSQNPNGEDLPRSGRPTLFTDHDRRRLIKLARKEPEISYQKLANDLGFKCHRSTIYRALREYGLTNWLAKKRPLLTEDTAKCLA